MVNREPPYYFIEDDVEWEEVDTGDVLAISHVHDTYTFGMMDGVNSVVVPQKLVDQLPEPLQQAVAEGIKNYLRKRKLIITEEKEKETLSYNNLTFGQLVSVDAARREAVFQPSGEEETTTVSLDMVRAIAEALVKSGAVPADSVVDTVYLSTGAIRPKIPQISVKSSIKFILEDIKKGANPDEVFTRGGERMREITAAIIKITSGTAAEIEDE